MPQLIGGFIVIGLWIAAIVGWVMNIITIAHDTGATGILILRIVGIFVAPLGAVLGYI